MPIAQVNNAEMRGLLESDFQRSADPSFLQRIMVSKYLHLPGIRGFWGPGYRNDSAYAGTPHITDQSGNGYHMPTVVAIPVIYTLGGRSYFAFTGANYCSLADNAHFDILANEAWINTPGLSLGAWVNTATARPYAGDEGILSKLGAAGNRAYNLTLSAGNSNRLTLELSDDGTKLYQFDHSKTILVNTWYFMAATFTPGVAGLDPAGVRIWVNEVMQFHTVSDRGTAGLPAIIFNSTQALQFASYNGAANLFTGFQAYWWICGNYIPQTDIYNLYETTKNIFGYVNEKGTSW